MMKDVKDLSGNCWEELIYITRLHAKARPRVIDEIFAQIAEEGCTLEDVATGGPDVPVIIPPNGSPATRCHPSSPGHGSCSTRSTPATAPSSPYGTSERRLNECGFGMRKY
jgi:hypothetical protein